MLPHLWENPIFVRARQVEDRRVGHGLRGLMSRFGVGALVTLGPLAVTMFFTAGELIMTPERWVTGWLPGVLGFTGYLSVVYFGVRAVNATSGSFSTEREQKTYDSLLATMLTSDEVVAGKLAAGLWPVLRELLAATPLALLLGALAGYFPQAAVFLLLSLCTILLFGLVGTWASYGAGSTQVANRCGTMLAGSLLFLGPVLDYLLYGLVMPTGIEFVPLGTLSSPLAACYSITQMGSDNVWHAAWAGTLAFYVFLISLLWMVVRLRAERARCA